MEQIKLRREPFIEYLHTTYCGGRSGGGLSLKSASDAASRLKRLESTLGFDIENLVAELPTQSRIELLKAIDTKIGGHADQDFTKKTLVDLKSAACKYLEFLRETRLSQAGE